MPLDWPAPEPAPEKPTTKEAEIRTVLLQEYGDHGNWARHYSTIRLTLGTFFITAATGMITVRWDRPQTAIAVSAGVVLLIGVFLFMVFSYFTFDHMTEQLKIVDSYTAKLGTGTAVTKKPKLWGWGTGLPIAVFFVIVFGLFDGWWLLGSKPKPSQVTQITVPMMVKVGQQPEVTIDVPIQVTAP
ncbi:MAG: hypothetical protein ABSE42_24080 [Bryobacteraceae bacterium]|jgi:hypothetical protein